LLGGLIDKLGNSRLQRDLSDSTSARNIGVGLSHSYLAISETIRGLKKLQINETRCLEELDNHPELLAEPIQTILRREGVDNPYNLLKEITRGKRVDLEELRKFVQTLDVSDKAKQQLMKLESRSYLGDAVRITRMVIKEVKNL
jgi:adenylosuccinate lyase